MWATGTLAGVREVSCTAKASAAVFSCMFFSCGQQASRPHPSADTLPSLFQGAHWKEEIW